jgi:hypothetical protein
MCKKEAGFSLRKSGFYIVANHIPAGNKGFQLGRI